MTLTCVIPFMYSEDRLLPLRRVLANARLLNCEVIVIEQGREQLLPSKEVLTDEKYLFLKNEFPFNKSWALNIAWMQASGDAILFMDADTLIAPDHVRTAVAALADCDFVSPHAKVIDLQESESDLPLEALFEIDRPGRGEQDRQKVPLCGGITLFTREGLEKVGGWPEEFFGWGGEDDAMGRKVELLLRWKELDFTCFHLFHRRGVQQPDWYKRNLEILDLYMDSDDEDLRIHIDQVRPLIGDSNRKFW
jgi:glycosyltransferase involved in cell wall biosynthesis